MNLTALQHSAFLQSLGWAIANSLWQSAVLWLVYYFINGWYKNSSSKFKNSLSTALLSCAFMWFCITLFYRYSTLLNTPFPQTYSQATNHPGWQIFTSSNFWNIILIKLSQALPCLSVAYLLLLILLSAKLINSYRFTNFIKTHGLQKPAAEWKLFTQKVSLHLGFTKQIKLWLSEHIDVPATIGFLKPVILIPLASINQLSVKQLEAIILHELSHIKRNDYLINLFISLVETILFFNPFVLLLSKIIKRERENCCDDFVIQYQYDRHSYASALLSLEQSRNTDFRFALTATSGKRQLLSRIQRIMEINNSNVNFNYGKKLLAPLLITGIICTIAWLSPEKNKNSTGLLSDAINKEIKNKAEKQQLLFTKAKNNILQKVMIKIDSKKTIAHSKKIAFRGTEKSILPKADKTIIEQANLNQNNKTPITAPFPIPYLPDEPTVYRNETAQGLQTNAINSSAEIERIKSKIKKANSLSNFYFEFNKMQSLIKLQLKAAELQSTAQNFNYYFNDRVEKLINTAIKNTDENNIKKQAQVYLRGIPQIQINPPHPQFLARPAVPNQIVFLNKSRKAIPAEDLERITTDKKNIKSPSDFSFHMNFGDNDQGNNNKSNKKSSAVKNNNLSIEYKNGVLVINGEKVHLPDNKKLIAKLKSQKLIPSDDEIISGVDADN